MLCLCIGYFNSSSREIPGVTHLKIITMIIYQQSVMDGINSIDLSMITQKIQDIKTDLDILKGTIHASLGIPGDLQGE